MLDSQDLMVILLLLVLLGLSRRLLGAHCV
jgi:hypothetical protein